MSSNRLIRVSRSELLTVGLGAYGFISYGVTVLYPAPSAVTNHTNGADSSSSNAELLGVKLYALAPFSPFTLVISWC